MIERRGFLKGSAAIAAIAATGPAWAAKLDNIPLIDCHIHLFDGTRPQGAPYKGGAAFPGGVAIPSMYDKIAEPLNIVGVIEVDASPWIEDNLWVLETIQSDPRFVGSVGNLQPDKPEFKEYIERYARNPLFRGIRYGNLWGYNLVTQLDNPVFIEGLKHMADMDLMLDTANQNLSLMQAAVKVSDKVPNLRIVMDHLPAYDPTSEDQAGYEAALKEIASRKNIYTKLSEIVHPVRKPGAVRGDKPTIVPGLAAHKDRLDLLFGYFGEDRVVFGSDWSNAVGVSEVPDTVALVREYFGGKSRAAAEKYFWKNSITAFKWVKRAPNQPSLA